MLFKVNNEKSIVEERKYLCICHRNCSKFKCCSLFPPDFLFDFLFSSPFLCFFLLPVKSGHLSSGSNFGTAYTRRMRVNKKKEYSGIRSPPTKISSVNQKPKKKNESYSKSSNAPPSRKCIKKRNVQTYNSNQIDSWNVNRWVYLKYILKCEMSSFGPKIRR